MIIDTTYNSLDEIDPEIVRFYSEDVRKRVLGYDEETLEHIYEEYTVIVLNQPDEVPYSHVSQRRGERKPWTVVKAELERAIAWEDFDVNHNQYLAWLDRPEPVRARNEDGTYVKDDTETEGINEAYVDGFTPEMYDAQLRPVIDFTVRQEHYDVTQEAVDTNLHVLTGEVESVYDDLELTRTDTPVVERKSDAEIATYHRELAKAEREELKEANIEVHGFWFQVRQQDRDNMSETIAYADRNGMRGTGSTQWITANNEPVSMSYVELQEIKDAYVLRMDSLFSQYGVWTAGDMQEPIEWVL